MKTNTLFRFFSAAVLAALIALPAAAQVDLSKMVLIGDSVGQGTSAACVTKRVQVDSPGAVLARTNGVDYQQPIVGDPGQGGCLVLTSLAPTFGMEPSTGVPENLSLPRPYNNLSVSGCNIHDMLTATTAAETHKVGDCRSLIDLVLRNSVFHIGSMVDQAVALGPSFVFLGNIANDYLTALETGTVIEGVTVTPVADFTADTNAAIAKLSAKQKNGIVFGPGDPFTVPFTTTLPPYVTSGGKLVLDPTGKPIPLLGPRCSVGIPVCPIPSTTVVTLYAAAYLPAGYGIPCAVAPTLPKCNNPLPDNIDAAGNPGVLLYADEVAVLKQRFADYVTAVKAACATYGYKYFDTDAMIRRYKAGYDFGGATVNIAFLTGGLTSYDGYHMTPIGYAIWADEITQFMNENFNAGLPRVNLSTYLFNGGTNGGLAGSSSYVPLNGEDYERAIQAIFTPEFARQRASGISLSRPPVVQGDSGPVQRLEPHHHGPEQP